MSDRWVPFDVNDAHEDPFEQFTRWTTEARPLLHDPDAVTLVTASSAGRPSARMVLLRHADNESFGWFTNYESRKAQDLAENPFAALLWYCEALGRQIRIEGSTKKMDEARSDAYFASRPRGHQIGAHASAQSHAIASRAVLEQRVVELTRDFEGREVPRPANWGGYVLMPDSFEFWQHRADRLHDRVLYSRNGDGGWDRGRFSP